MKTEIEIIRVNEENQKATIIGLENNKVVIYNEFLKTIDKWDLEDLKQCVKFL